MHFLFRNKIWRRRFIGSAQKSNQHTKARLILLPEVPSDTAESNAFIKCIENKELANFKQWAFKDSVNGVAKIGLEYEGWMLEHFETIADPDNAATSSSFAAVMDPLERNCVPVDHAWYTFLQHYTALYSDNDNARSHAVGLQKLMTRLTHVRFSTPGFYKILKELHGKVSDGWERRLCEKYLLECHLNGSDLTAHKSLQLGEIRARYRDKKIDYNEHIVNSAVKLPDRPVESATELPDAPEHVFRVLADNPDGPVLLPFSIRYSPAKFSLYMLYCKSRLARWGWWLSVNSRAAFKEDMIMFNNSSLVEEMRSIRQREAKWLGYKTYAEMQLRMCMAKSVDEINQFLTKFGEKAADSLDQVYEEMCGLAEADGESKREPPDAWDLPFYARKVAKEKYKLDHYQFAEYFPYPQTMKNILKYVERLFGIEFRDVSESAPRWHPTVEVYEIQRNGKLVAHIYIDPYLRSGKFLASYALEGRPKSSIVGMTPVTYLNLTLTPPTLEKPSLIYFDQLSSMTFELGRALQFVLSEAPYSPMAGENLIEWDCRNICGHVMELLIARRPHVLADISYHYQSGSKVDLETAKRHVTGAIVTNLPSVVREVVDSELDLSLYTTQIFWRETYAKLHAKYLPYKWDKRKGDEFICNFGGYATEKIGAKYFSCLWSKWLASDIVDTFDQSGNENEFDVGKRYADVYLASGGKYSQAEAFRRFRGRDPILDPMFKYYVAS